MVAIALLHASAFNLSPDTVATGTDQLERSVAMFDRLAAEGLSSEEFRSQHAFAHNRMGAVCTVFRRDYTAAARHYEEALAIGQRLVIEHPERADLRYNLTFAEHDLAEVRRTEGRLPEALAGFRRTLAAREAIAAADPADVRAQAGISSACRSLSETARLLKQFPEAMGYAQRSIAIEERLAGSGRTRSRDLGNAWWALANVHLGWAKAEERGAAKHLDLAAEYYRLAFAVYVQRRKDGIPQAAGPNSEKLIAESLAETETLRRHLKSKKQHI